MNEKEAKKILKKICKLKYDISELQDEELELREQLQSYFEEQMNHDNQSKKSIEVDGNKAILVETAYIDYNAYKLEQKLKRAGKNDISKKVIRKKYVVFRWGAFTEFLKSAGILPSTIRGHLEIERTVDKNTLKNLFEKGDITKEDLEGCFDMRVVKSLRIT